MESTNIEAKFYEEVFPRSHMHYASYTDLALTSLDQIHTLECKYHELYTPLYAKRTLIANGEYEPTEEVKLILL